MSDWPDIENPDSWEQNYWGPEGPDVNESKNTRLMIIMGDGWRSKDIDVIKWITNVDPPQWAMWEKTSEE